MKNALIAFLIFTNLVTFGAGYVVIQHVKEANDEKFEARLNYLELQYAGFCSDANTFGITNGEHYQILCGNE